MLKVFKFDKKKSTRDLEKFLNKRKLVQKNTTSAVANIIKNVKKNGDRAVLNYEQKFSKIKTKSNKVFFNGTKLKLTSHEYKIIEYFLHHQDKVISRTELVEHIYDQDFDREDDINKRIDMIVEQVANYQHKDVKDKVLHNFNHFWNTDLVERSMTREIIEPILDFIESR